MTVCSPSPQFQFPHFPEPKSQEDMTQPTLQDVTEIIFGTFRKKMQGLGYLKLQQPTNSRLHRREDKTDILVGTAKPLNQAFCALVLRMDSKCTCSQGHNLLRLESFLTGKGESSSPQLGYWKICSSEIGPLI